MAAKDSKRSIKAMRLFDGYLHAAHVLLRREETAYWRCD